jgi:hypothetical protein
MLYKFSTVGGGEYGEAIGLHVSLYPIRYQEQTVLSAPDITAVNVALEPFYSLKSLGVPGDGV